MLEQIAADEEIGKTTAWTAFSGLLDDSKIKSADWGDRRKRQASDSSAKVYDIAQFDTSTGSVTINSPAPHVPYSLTVHKVKASERPDDYEPLEPVHPIKVTFKGKGAAAKRKHGEIDGDGKDEEEMDEGSDGDGSGSGSQ